MRDGAMGFAALNPGYGAQASARRGDESACGQIHALGQTRGALHGDT